MESFVKLYVAMLVLLFHCFGRVVINGYLFFRALF